METSNNFHNLYPLSKTLRFSLIPQGKTLDYIVKNGLIEQDTHRAESYKIVKTFIDRYHKKYIESTLSDFKLKLESSGKKDSLEEFLTYYMLGNKTEAQKKYFSDIQDGLRKQIASRLTGTETYKRINKKELINEDLLEFLDSENDRELVKEFASFTTYFTGYNKNRENMYSAEAKSTAIAYRLIHENLPRFIDNMYTFTKLMSTDLAGKLSDLYSDFEQYLNVKSINDLFRLSYYSNLLTQPQIDAYNTVIGGISLENGTKVNGLNEYINLYNQKQPDRHDRLPKFKILYKQILSDRNTTSWLPEAFVSDEEVLESIEQYYRDLNANVMNGSVSGWNSLKQLLEKIDEYDSNRIFVSNDLQLTDISQKIFGKWSEIQYSLTEKFKSENPQAKRETNEKYVERIQKHFKNIDAFSIREIDKTLFDRRHESGKYLSRYFSECEHVPAINENKTNIFDYIDSCYAKIKDLLNTKYPSGKRLVQDKININKIKTFLDAVKELQHFVKPLLAGNGIADKDEKFYGEFMSLWDELDKITPLYNKVRNYVTRKPYSEDKIKLNFENSTLLDGWDLNKERANTAVILVKEGQYYLGIMNKRHNAIFEPENIDDKGECYKKMVYKLLPGPNKMLPKVFFSAYGIKSFDPSDEIIAIRRKESFKKGDNFDLGDCRKMIDFYKKSIDKHPDWSKFGFKFSATESYNDIGEFYKEVARQGYKISFVDVAADYVNRMVDEGKLYLFKIFNKDFSPYSKGRPNLHSIYWRMLFDERNLKDVVYKLNGEAEIFFRKASLRYDRPTHPANLPINNKQNDRQAVFPYDLIKDRRYTVDHFQFHVPVTMNFKSENTTNINTQVNTYIKGSEDLHIIGVDRGERNLLYVSLIDSNGNIKKQFSLNEIDGVNYRKLLDEREELRLNERKSWKSIEGIKELKEGYLSKVIRVIADLIVKYNAIVVMEDLNFGFMRSRQKVEKQVYQKFEHMLIDKLNYLVDKEKDPSEPGGALKAYQFTNKFESFQSMGKQSGFLFYVPAWNTSQMDPVTGFVNLLDLRYESIEKSREFIKKFDSITYDKENKLFKFTFDYDNFLTRTVDARKRWTICTYGDRIITFRNPEKNSNWDTSRISLTEEFLRLFKRYNVNIDADLKTEIAKQSDKIFFYNDRFINGGEPGLLQLLKCTLQMRNSILNTDIDYLISPVADEYGKFFDSRESDGALPENADANGAYNIARKGLWVVNQIKRCTDFKKLELAISNKEWLDFAQNKPYHK